MFVTYARFHNSLGAGADVRNVFTQFTERENVFVGHTLYIPCHYNKLPITSRHQM